MGENILVPDLAGWKDERYPEEEPFNWISVVPDWICEVLSPGAQRIDEMQKMPIYARHKERIGKGEPHVGPYPEERCDLHGNPAIPPLALDQNDLGIKRRRQWGSDHPYQFSCRQTGLFPVQSLNDCMFPFSLSGIYCESSTYTLPSL